MNQLQQLFLETVEVTGRMLIDDDEVRLEAVRVPEFVGQEQLAHQSAVLGPSDAQQHDRNVARDAVAPQRRWPRRLALSTDNGARSEASGYSNAEASRWYICTLAGETCMWRISTWL